MRAGGLRWRLCNLRAVCAVYSLKGGEIQDVQNVTMAIRTPFFRVPRSHHFAIEENWRFSNQEPSVFKLARSGAP
jgi:hypothetical protein